MSEMNSTWSIALPPNTLTNVQPHRNIEVIAVALASSLKDPYGRTTLEFTYPTSNNVAKVVSAGTEVRESGSDVRMKTTILCSLIGGKFEQCPLQLLLEKNMNYAFRAIGANEMFVTGKCTGVPTSDGAAGFIDPMPMSPKRTLTNPPIDTPKKKQKDDSPAEDKYPDQPMKAHLDVTSGTDSFAHERISSAGHHHSTGFSPLRFGVISTPPKTPKLRTGSRKNKPLSESRKDKDTLFRKGKSKEAGPKVIIQDKVLGNGDVIELGSAVECWALMRLGDGTTVIDITPSKSKEPFSLNVGAGEVIQGWDENIAGMKVGGQRQLTIPPEYAFGDEQFQNVPPNSVLVLDFTVVSTGKPTGTGGRTSTIIKH